MITLCFIEPKSKSFWWIWNSYINQFWSWTHTHENPGYWEEIVPLAFSYVHRSTCKLTHMYATILLPLFSLLRNGLTPFSKTSQHSWLGLSFPLQDYTPTFIPPLFGWLWLWPWGSASYLEPSKISRFFGSPLLWSLVASGIYFSHRSLLLKLCISCLSYTTNSKILGMILLFLL